MMRHEGQERLNNFSNLMDTYLGQTNEQMITLKDEWMGKERKKNIYIRFAKFHLNTIKYRKHILIYLYVNK